MTKPQLSQGTLAAYNFYTRNAVSTWAYRPKESYSDMTEYHGYESVHDPKVLIGIVDDDDDDDPGTC